MRRLNDKYRHHFYLCAILAVFLLRGHPCVADEDDQDVEHFDAFGEIDGLTKEPVEDLPPPLPPDPPQNPAKNDPKIKMPRNGSPWLRLASY